MNHPREERAEDPGRPGPWLPGRARARRRLEDPTRRQGSRQRAIEALRRAKRYIEFGSIAAGEDGAWGAKGSNGRGSAR